MSSCHGGPNLTSTASTAAAAAALTPVLRSAFNTFTGSMSQMYRRGFSTDVSRASSVNDLERLARESGHETEHGDPSESGHGTRQAVPRVRGLPVLMESRCL